MQATEADEERATEQLNIRLTPAQVKAIDALRYSMSPPLTKAQLIDAALAEYFEARGDEYPLTTRRAA